MATKTLRRPARRPYEIHTPKGSVHPRVQEVGPEQFGIIAVECAKARDRWMFADFYGKVIIGHAELDHSKPAFRHAVDRVRLACSTDKVLDSIFVIERIGIYHHVVRDTFTAAGFEVRIVPPSATKQFRQPADAGNKTDETDLSAIHRASRSTAPKK